MAIPNQNFSLTSLGYLDMSENLIEGKLGPELKFYAELELQPEELLDFTYSLQFRRFPTSRHVAEQIQWLGPELKFYGMLGK
ncbi:hypothetical protein Tco_1230471 [Tanacetum coccineum]